MTTGVYQVDDNCAVLFQQHVPLGVLFFEVGDPDLHDPDCIYDALTVNGDKYCGTSGPDGQVTTALS